MFVGGGGRWGRVALRRGLRVPVGGCRQEAVGGEGVCGRGWGRGEGVLSL